MKGVGALASINSPFESMYHYPIPRNAGFDACDSIA